MRGKRVDVAPYIDKLCTAVQLGATYQLAALFAGISHDTFLCWRKAMATAKTGPLVELRERLRQAEGQAAVRWLALINRAADVDWKAASWLLSHRYPEQYGGGLQKVALTSPAGDQPAPQLQIICLPSTSPSPEQWAQDVAALRYPVHGAAPEPRPEAAD